MPYINKTTLLAKAGISEHKKSLTPIQQNKEQPKLSKVKISRQKLGHIRPPPRAITRNIEEPCANKKFVEYRTGFFKGMFEMISKNSLDNDEKRKLFTESIRESKDIPQLVFETHLIKTLDEINGVPKIIITILSKWAEANYLS